MFQVLHGRQQAAASTHDAQLAETVCREVEPPQVDLAGHRFHCHVASRELERCGGDAAKTSVVMQAAITAATSDSTEPHSAV